MSGLTGLGLYLLLFRIYFVPWAGDAGNLRQGLADTKGVALGLGLHPRWSLDPLRLDDWLRHCCIAII